MVSREFAQNGERHSATLVSTRRITPESAYEDVRHLVFAVSGSSFRAQAGQNIRIVLPGPGGVPHFRFYSIADHGGRADEFALCVRRCFSVDPQTLETRPGLVSNFLCDLQPGQKLSFVGPFGQAFPVPENRKAPILMIGVGTGIAPFRAYVGHLYDHFGGWEGKVRLFYGARTGLEMLYMNDEQWDLANYYERKTFKAFHALSPVPRIDAPADLHGLLVAHAMEVWSMIDEPDSHVFVAGRESALAELENPLREIAESDADWKRRTSQMVAQGRWQELLY